MMKPKLPIVRTSILLAAAVSAPITHAASADGTWSATTGGNWSDSTKWTSGIIADGAGFTANFTSNITANNTLVYLDGSRTLGNITFDDSGATADSTWLVVGSPLTLDGTTPTITTTTGAWLSSNIGGSAGLTKAGAQGLTLTGINTYTGTTTVNGGTVSLGIWGTLGGGSHADNIDIISGTFSFTSHANQTLSGVISGSGALTKATGGGTLTISNATNSLSGATTVSAGTLNLTGTLGSSAITVNAGGTLTGTGSTTGNITFANASGILLSAAGAVQGATVTVNPTTYLFVNEAPTGALVTRDVIRYTDTGALPSTTSFTENYRSGVLTDTGTKITLDYVAEAKTWNSTTGGTWENSVSTLWSGGSDTDFFWGDSVTFGGTDTQTVTMVGPLAPSSTTVNNSAGTITFAAGSGGALIGGGGLTKSGAGTLVINGGGNIYKGATAVNGGTLTLQAGASGQLAAYATSSFSVGNTATLEFGILPGAGFSSSVNPPVSLADGATLRHSSSSGGVAYYTVLSHTLTVAGNTTISAPTVNANPAGNIAGLFLDGGLKGSGTLTINGGNAGNGVVFRDFISSDLKSDFTGNIIVNGVADGAVDAGSGISVRGAQLTLSKANIEVNGTMDLGGNTGNNGTASTISAMNWAQSGTGIVTIGGLSGTGVVASNNGTSTLIVGNNDATASFAGTLVNGTATGAASILNLTKVGSGTQTLSGDNSFTGTTTIDDGTLRLNHENALKASVFNTDSAGTLIFGDEVTGNAFTLGGLSGTGNLALVNSAAAPITLSLGSSTLTYPGQLSGAGSLVKTGAGILTLSGSSTHSGTTTVSAGRLNVSGSLANSDLSLSASGALGGEGSIKSISLNGGTLHVDPATPGALTASNGLSITAPVVVSLSATPPGPGPITILEYSGTFTGSLANLTSTDARANFSDSAGTITMQLGAAASRTWGGADGTWESGGSGTYWVEGDQKFFNGDSATFPDPAGAKTVTLSGTLLPTSTTVTNSSGNNYTFTGGNLSGTGGITKNGTGTLIINNGAHTYTGTTVVNDGVLQYQGSITNHATTYSGAGTVRTAVMTGTVFNSQAVFGNGFTGLLDLTENLNMATHPGFANNLGDLSVAATKIFAINGSTLQFDVLSGSGTISNTAGATSAPATIRFGANNGTGSFSGTFTSPSNATNGRISLIKNGSGTQTLAGTVNSGNGTVTVNAGTLVMSATGNTIAGAFAVNGGTLKVNGTKTGGGGIQVANTGTLGGSGSIAGAVLIQSGGTLAPGDSVGNLTFTSTVNLASGASYVAEIASGGNDKVTATTLTANGTIKVTLVGGYSPAAGTVFDIADATIAPASAPTFDFSAATLGAGLSWNTSSFATNGTIQVISTDPFNAWATANNVTGGKNGDDDNDGVSNLVEFATAANPQSGSSGARVYPLVHTLGGQKVLTYTVATRAAATFAANGSKQQADKDGVRYAVEASNQLGTWDSVVVSELVPADASAVQAALGTQLNGLDAAWQWHSFRTDGDTASDASDYIRLNVTEAP